MKMKLPTYFHALLDFRIWLLLFAVAACSKGTLKKQSQSSGGNANVNPNTQPDTQTSLGPLPAMLSFTAVTGADYGQIVLTGRYIPADALKMTKVVVRKKKGPVAPAADCSPESGELAGNFLPPFTDFNIIDNTQSLTGEAYSYRACVFTIDGRINSELTAVNVTAMNLPTITALPTFAAATSATTDGEISLAWTYPTDKRRLQALELWRMAGPIVPAADGSNGTKILTLAPPFTMASFNDQTGNLVGGTFSYRLRIIDVTGASTGGNIAAGIRARDTLRPEDFQSFTGGAGTVEGHIILTIRFPQNVADIDRVLIAKLKGSTVPADCSTGVIYEVAKPFPGAGQTTTTIIDSGSFSGDLYSFRLCSMDVAGNINSNATLASIKEFSVPYDVNMDTVRGGGQLPTGELVFYLNSLLPKANASCYYYTWRPMMFRLTASGQPDRSFGNTGFAGRYAYVPPDCNSDSWGNVEMLPNGKTLAIIRHGSSTAMPDTLLRAQADGVPDATFNGSGRLELINKWYTRLLSAPAGKTVVAYGDAEQGISESLLTYESKHSFITRLNDNGSVDTSFGTSGVVNATKNSAGETLPGPLPRPHRVNPDFTMNSLVGGDSPKLARTLANGLVDKSFYPTGLGVKPAPGIPSMGFGTYTSHDTQVDGKMVFAQLSGSGGTILRAYRVNADGTTDTSFNGGTPLTIHNVTYTPTQNGVNHCSGANSAAYVNVKVLASGKIVIVFAKYKPNTTDPSSDVVDIGVARLNANGTLDTNFGTAGVASQNCQSSDNPAVTIHQNDGKIVVASNTLLCRLGTGSSGTSVCGCSFGAYCAVRFNENGSLDTSFAKNGKYEVIPCTNTTNPDYCW